ncbi:MAG: hypothetical protein J7L86_05690 [Candidatus Marinimicrobia bacterium]|nr:hypothetical protein [Candidatus Neomarinimicrobiota bacterium]
MLKNVFKWGGIGLGGFFVLVLGIFLLLKHLEPIDEETQIEITSNDKLMSKKLLMLKQSEIDSLNSCIEKLQSDLSFLNLTNDSLKAQSEFKNNLIEEYKKSINQLNNKLTAATKTTVSIQELAKTYESMKPEEMRPILQKVSDKTIIAIYKNMNARKRKDILNALSSERAAAITQQLAGASKG